MAVENGVRCDDERMVAVFTFVPDEFVLLPALHDVFRTANVALLDGYGVKVIRLVRFG